VVLGWIGFDAAQPAASTGIATLGLQAFYAVIPGTIGLIAAACMMGYPLTEERHREILRQLGEKDAAGPAPVPEDIAVLNVTSPKPAE
jgi:glycoside/pentoside/hexuronide:cation symporter, GPH family